MEAPHRFAASFSESKWRVFYTMPRAEKKCESQLLEKSIETFLPKRKVVRNWSDRKKKVVEPLFANYIFARVNEKERISVLQTQGIVRCVSFNGRPAIVSPQEIDQLRLLQKKPDLIEPYYGILPPKGTEVSIESGPLRGLKGLISDHKGKSRVIVNVPSIKQCVRIVIPASELGWTYSTTNVEFA